MNYCAHCGTRLGPDGRCPSCAAVDEGLPRIVEQTALPVPPPPPPGSARVPPPPSVAPRPVDPAATVILPSAPGGPDHNATQAMPTAAAVSAAVAPAAWEPTRIIRSEQVQPAVQPEWQEVRQDEYVTTLDDPQSWRRSQLATVGVIAAILLLAGLGVVLWNLLADDPDSIDTVDTLPGVSTVLPADPADTLPPSTLPAPGTTAEGTLPERPTLTIAPTVPTLVPPSVAPTVAPVIVPAATSAPASTERPTTPQATEPPPAAPQATDPPPETFPPATDPPPDPPPPPPPPGSSAGEPQVLQDPLPSGAAYGGGVRESHILSQRLADALALEDWDTARALSPPLANSSDATLRNGYGGLDRASLILIDAREQGDSTRLLIVSVANELDGSRTSLYCFEWVAQPGAGTVRQSGGIGRIAQRPGTLTPDQVRADGDLDAAIRNECVFS